MDNSHIDSMFDFEQPGWIETFNSYLTITATSPDGQFVDLGLDTAGAVERIFFLAAGAGITPKELVNPKHIGILFKDKGGKFREKQPLHTVPGHPFFFSKAAVEKMKESIK